jgi:hypothetical protein
MIDVRSIVLICEKMNGIWEGQGVYIDRREWSDPWMSLTKSLAGALRHRSCDAGPARHRQRSDVTYRTDFAQLSRS